jgi:2-succinyl-5-enolpyruvyl-6-hydroxy-3-cyclohexene-1-carboxylate synthase
MAAEKGKQDLADRWAEPSFRYVAAGWKKHESAGVVSCMGMASGTDGLLSTEVGIGAAFAPMLIA